MQTILNGLQTAIAVIFVFGLLIASHELGHFTVAKLSGVKVLEFALGMGPKIFGFKRGETNYSLRLLPIGGYVKMLGEEEDSNDPRAVCNINPWKRILISLAGAFMNFVLAIVLFTIVLYNVGIPAKEPIIGVVVDNRPAMEAGVKADDKILSVNDTKIDKWEDFTAFLQDNKDKTFKLTVLRNNKTVDLNITPKFDEKENRYLVGVNLKVEKGNIFVSIKNGVSETFSAVTWMVDILLGAFKGEMKLSDFGGPVAVVKMSGEVAKLGILQLLSFAGALSINLGIINLIPFPALDGGWVVILLIQAITGKKIDENKIGYINLIGFVVLFGLMILVTVKDIFTIGSF
ncbi:MAG: rseP [Clostridiales bacterium]|nr:rseP [Clostridiales bacterium]